MNEVSYQSQIVKTKLTRNWFCSFQVYDRPLLVHLKCQLAKENAEIFHLLQTILTCPRDAPNNGLYAH